MLWDNAAPFLTRRLHESIRLRRPHKTGLCRDKEGMAKQGNFVRMTYIIKE